MRNLLSTRVSDMPTPQDQLNAFLLWLHKSKDMEVCRRSFGEWRPERSPEKLVAEYLATRKGPPPESVAPTSSPPAASIPRLPT
jgi:hypothetical protein